MLKNMSEPCFAGLRRTVEDLDRGGIEAKKTVILLCGPSTPQASGNAVCGYGGSDVQMDKKTVKLDCVIQMHGRGCYRESF